MKNMDKGLTVPKWVLINWPKIPQMPQNLFALLIVCPNPKVWDFNEKRLHWASLVCGQICGESFCNILCYHSGAPKIFQNRKEAEKEMFYF